MGTPFRYSQQIRCITRASFGMISGRPSCPFLQPKNLAQGRVKSPFSILRRIPHLIFSERLWLSSWASEARIDKSISHFGSKEDSDSFSKNTSTPISFSSRTIISKSTVFLESRDMDLQELSRPVHLVLVRSYHTYKAKIRVQSNKPARRGAGGERKAPYEEISRGNHFTIIQ